MVIRREQIEYLADLAGLQLTQEEKDLFSKQLDRIIGYVEKLNELDVSEVAPTSHTQNLTNALRPDVCRQGLNQEEALRLAPDRQGDYFRVPKVIENE